MKKTFITLALTLFLLNTSGSVLSEEMAKEGSYTSKNIESNFRAYHNGKQILDTQLI